MYYEINEALAKQAQQANSFRDYVPGSETAEYRKAVDAAAAIAQAQKKKVSTFYHDKIDRLLDGYSRRLAAWYNDYNRNRASCPSIMISGGSNFPVRKKEKQISRDHTLFAEYDEIKAIVDKIKSVGTGAVDLADPNARDILNEQLEAVVKERARAKRVNAYFRKKGTVVGCPEFAEGEDKKFQKALEDLHSHYGFHDVPYPEYELNSLRGKEKRIRERLAQLDKIQAQKEQPGNGLKFDGGEIVRNADLNRLQILFDDIPDDETRQALKSNGFRWSPKNKAWQRQLTENAVDAAKKVLGI